MRRTARITGLLYLVIIICAGFAQGGVREQLIVDGDPGSTADSIRASLPLFRAGLFLDLVAFMADAAVAVLFYSLLRGAGRTLALVAAAFRLIAHPAIGSLNLLEDLVDQPDGMKAGQDYGRAVGEALGG